DWAVADNPGDDAQRFRSSLQRQRQLELLDRERFAMNRSERALTTLESVLPHLAETPVAAASAKSAATELGSSLRALLLVNMDYVSVAFNRIRTIQSSARLFVIVCAVAGLAASVVLAMWVRSDIAARFRRMTDSIESFRRRGVYERIADSHQDDIAMLANALDTGITALQERDRERERFLAVAAHELKTPLTSMLGFTQAALE